MIAHNKPTLGIEEQEAANRVIKSGWLASGPEVEALQYEFCQFVGLPEGHAIAVSSGTAALYLVLQQLNIANKTVNTPVYACSALRNAIRMANGKANFCDNHSNSVHTDLSSLSLQHKEINSVSIRQHIYGFVAPQPASSINLQIEDCAQALGSYENKKHVGLNGIAGIFSFYATKMITSGGHGGMIIAKDKNMINAIKDYLDFDCRFDQKIRFNFQMTDIQAAIAREQLKKLPTFIERRQEIFSHYSDRLPMLIQDCYQPNNCKSTNYRALLKTNNPKNFITAMAKQGICCIEPMETRELQTNTPQNYPNAYNITNNLVSLPIYPDLSQQQVNHVIASVEGYL